MSTKAEKMDPLTGELLPDRKPSEVNRHHDPEGVRARLRAIRLDDHGRELVDPRPMSPPLGYKKQPSIFDLQRQQIALYHRLYAEDREFESFEESEDFDVDDDIDPTSPWENDFDPPMSEVRRAIEEDKAARAAAKPAEQPLQSPPPPAPPSQQPAPAAAPAPLAQDKS